MFDGASLDGCMIGYVIPIFGSYKIIYPFALLVMAKTSEVPF